MNQDRAVQITLLLLRVVAAVMFIQVGGMKLFGWFGGMPPNHDTAKAFTLIWFAGVLEVFGGLLILLGLWTRPVAFILSGQMAFAYFIGHAKNGTWPIENHGELAVFYCFFFLYLAARGAGEYSADAVMAKKRRRF